MHYLRDIIMLCWSCGKGIADDAKFCVHCEAEVEPEPTQEEITAVENALAGMPADVIDQLRDAFDKSASGEEFVNRLMVGDCPICDSSNTHDCEKDPEIEDPCVGHCVDCGQLWCLDCDEVFQTAQAAADHACPFWEEFGLDDDE